jgi:hypothetical protein
MDPELGQLVVEFVEKTGLLRRDMQKKGAAEEYAARFNRMEQKLNALADRAEASDPDLARALRNAWARPAMSLAYRNAEHQKRDD